VDIPINVPVDEQQAQRIRRQEGFWSAPKLVVLLLVTLGLALTTLYLLASYSDGSLGL
jgi:hypothetical protein